MSVLRNLLLRASRSRWLREQIPRRAFARRAVRRFMPGEDVSAALAAAERLREHGIAAVLTQLGENVEDAADARAVARHYTDVLDRIAATELDCELSVKPTHLGLDLDPDLAAENLDALVHRAVDVDGFVWIDMESSEYVEPTLELFRRTREAHSAVGVCLQSYLYRTPDDLQRLLPMAPAIRLVKGAYAEPAELAYPDKRDVDTAFFELGRTLLNDIARGAAVRVGLGTHDITLVRRLGAVAEELGLPRHVFEVQMLYGIRREEQLRLAREGYRVRVLISYGDAWYPWFVRRLAERPANLLFVLRNVFAR